MRIPFPLVSIPIRDLMNLNQVIVFPTRSISPVSIPIRDLMNLNLAASKRESSQARVSIPIRDLMNLNPVWFIGIHPTYLSFNPY